MPVAPIPVASDLASAGHAVAAPPMPVPALQTTSPWLRPGFHRWHLQTPLLALAGLFITANLLHADLWLADRLYTWEGHAWALRHAWFTQHLIHLLGREFSTAAWLAVLAAWLVACVRPGWGRLRRPLLYLLMATAASTLLVAGLKSLSNVDCPWDLARYGGTHPYIGLFELRPTGLGRGQCFPAGHASGGYTWLALYFFLSVVKPQWRWAGLAVGLGFGLLFGIGQQLRGAHFLSHDLAALAICWTCAVVLHRVFWRDESSRPAGIVTAP
jgi:membrane-associated PAP2 superfamily phosphatase